MSPRGSFGLPEGARGKECYWYEGKFGVDKHRSVNYVGITKQDFNKRLAQHHREGRKEIEDLKEVYEGELFTRNQARALEQYYIEEHGGAKLHGGEKLLNRIDSIGKRNRYRDPACACARAHVKSRRT